MSDAALAVMLRRDRAVVIAAVAAITALAWAYILWLALRMPMGDMATPETHPGATMREMLAPALRIWSPPELAFMFVMWSVMMIGMMLPSVAPMLLIHARVARQAAAAQRPIAGTAWFAGGYLLAWVGFALGATFLQAVLERALLLTPAMASASNVFGGIILIVAGLYQWTPLKNACLTQCQSPLLFFRRHGGIGRDARGSLRLGILHGLYCVGCCWALMALLFVGGIMNVLWIAAIALFVLLEKVVARGQLISRLAGLGAIAAGVWLLVFDGLGGLDFLEQTG